MSAGQESGGLMMLMLMMMMLIHDALYVYTCSKRKEVFHMQGPFRDLADADGYFGWQREKVHELYQLVHHRDHAAYHNYATHGI